jgi:hypothetical protein
MGKLFRDAWREATIEVSIEMGYSTAAGIKFAKAMDAALQVLVDLTQWVSLTRELKGKICCE